MFTIAAAALYRTLAVTGVRPYTATIGPDGVAVAGPEVSVFHATDTCTIGTHTRKVADLKADLISAHPTAEDRRGATYTSHTSADRDGDYRVPAPPAAPGDGAPRLTLPAEMASVLSGDAVAAGASVIALVETTGAKAIATDRYVMVVRDLDIAVPDPIHVHPLALRCVLALAPGEPITLSTDSAGRSLVIASSARALSTETPLLIAPVMLRLLSGFAEQTGDGRIAEAAELPEERGQKAVAKLLKANELEPQPTSGQVAAWVGDGVAVYAMRARH